MTRFKYAQLSREKWMAAFESMVVSQDAKHAGKLDWDTAAFFYNSGKTPLMAATLYVEARKDK